MPNVMAALSNIAGTLCESYIYAWFIVKSNNKHIMLRLHSNTDKHSGEKRRKYNKLPLKSWL